MDYPGGAAACPQKKAGPEKAASPARFGGLPGAGVFLS
jgi:hypothetical protein